MMNIPMKNKDVFFAVLLGILVASGMNCSSSKSDSDEAQSPSEPPVSRDSITLTAPQRKEIGIQTIAVEQREISIPLTFPGHVEPAPDQEAYITSLIDGRIEHVLAHVGDRVKKGQPIVGIIGSDLGQYIENLHIAWVELDQQNRLTEHGVGVPQDLENARITYAAASRQLALFGVPAQQIDTLAKNEGDLSEISITAPIGGIILDMDAVLGGPVSAGDKLLHIINLTPICVSADVYENDLGKLAIGQSVQVTAQANPGMQYQGTIEKIIPWIDAEERTARVLIRLPNEHEELNPGMYVTIQIQTSLETVNAVPEDAVLIDGTASYLVIADNDSTFHRLEIKAHTGNSPFVAVPEAPLGANVVRTGGFQIMSAMKGVKAESDD